MSRQAGGTAYFRNQRRSQLDFEAKLGVVTRRRWLLVCGAALVVAGIVAVAFPALVRWRVGAAAARAGLVVEVESVRPGWGRVWLLGVKVEAARVRGVTAQLGAVEVELGWTGAAGVTVHGGSVRVGASRQELVEAFRARSEGAQGAGASRRVLRGEGLFVEWLAGPGESAKVWGASFERSGAGVRASAERVELEHSAGQVWARGVQGVFDRSLQVRSATAAEARVEVDFSRVLEGLASRETEPPEDGGPVPAPSVTAAPPSQPKAPAPTAPAAPVWAGATALPSLDSTRATRLTTRARRIAGLIARRLPEGATIELAGVTVRLGLDEGGMTLGPAQVRVAREPDFVRLEFVPATDAQVEHRVSVTARLPIEAGESRVEVAGGPVRLSALGLREGDLGLRRLNDAQLEIRADLTLSDDGTKLLASSTGRVEGLTISRPALGKLPLDGLSFGWKVKGAVATDGSAFSVDSGEFNVGAMRVETGLVVKQTAESVSASARLQVPLGSCAEMLASLPRNLVPFAPELQMGGTFSWSTSIAFDSRRLSDMEVHWKVQDDCRFEKVPPALSPAKFRGPFSREVPDANGLPISLLTGPGTEQWTPLPEISRFMEAAVLVSEDGRFFSHRGFDPRAIESSIRQNVEAGRFVRGASTISMQLAKNLYLTREKTLSRKVQEALLTMLLEQELRKDEILELYFNVIELGPGIYGVRQGAEHYFHSTPADLSVAQAFFLATLLPSPSAQHFDESGALKPQWRRYVDRLMRIAAERERISQVDLEAGLREELRFGVPSNSDHAPIEPGPQDSVTGDPLPF